MSFSPLNSELFGPLFATDAMRACFSDTKWVGSMLAVEAALARSESQLGLAPAALAPAIEAIRPEELDIAALGVRAGVAGVPTIPFVQAVQARLPAELERSFHKGATTQDIIDTALVLRIRDALMLITVDLSAIMVGLARLADQHRTTACVGRSSRHRGARQLRLQGRRLAHRRRPIPSDRLPELRKHVLLVASLALSSQASTGFSRRRRAKGLLAGLRARRLVLVSRHSVGTRTAHRIAEAGAWLVEVTGALAKDGNRCRASRFDRSGRSRRTIHRRTRRFFGHAAQAQSGGCDGDTGRSCRGERACVDAVRGDGSSARAPGWIVARRVERSAVAVRPGVGRLARGATLAEGLVVDADRMRANIDLTHGLLFADAAAARLGTRVGRETAHRLVEHAAEQVRQTGASLADVLAQNPTARDAGVDLTAAFDLDPALAAAARWVAPALNHADGIRARLASDD